MGETTTATVTTTRGDEACASLAYWQAELARLIPHHPQTDQEAVQIVMQSIRQAEQAVASGAILKTQQALEEALGQLLVALHRYTVQADQALLRLQTRWSRSGVRRLVAYPDYVEVWVGPDYRGGWPLHHDSDRFQVERLAQELGCSLVFADSRQLGLFS